MGRRAARVCIISMAIATVVAGSAAAAPGGSARGQRCAHLPDLGHAANAHDPGLTVLENQVLLCQSRAGQGAQRADFNGDGFADLAIGVPDEDAGRIADAGAVDIVYGAPSGLGPTGSQHLTQSVSSAGGDPPEAGDRFGSAIAAGNFNGDGFTDLAVGVPGEDLGSASDAGLVQVFYGSNTGLQPTDPTGHVQLWTEAALGRTSRAGDLFGFALAWGRFNGDALGDLAVGTPGRGVMHNGVLQGAAGEVDTIYGSAVGLTATGSQAINADTPGISDVPASGDQLGAALTAANFGLSPQDDLAIGVPFNDGFATDTGSVDVVYGTSGGLDPSVNAQSFTPTNLGEPARAGEAFGSVMTAGSFDTVAGDDLVVGIPLDDVTRADGTTAADAGAVGVIYGSNQPQIGIRLDQSTTQQLITQDSGTIADEAEAGDHFGAALASNDFDGAVADLAVGVPLEDIGRVADAGAVNIIYATTQQFRLGDQGNQLLTQGSHGIAERAESGDQFGAALSAWNFGEDSRSDLAIGAPFEDIGSTFSIVDAGVVDVVYSVGTPAPSCVCLTEGSQILTQNGLGADPSEAGDAFGGVMY